jgi:spermidine synthase
MFSLDVQSPRMKIIQENALHYVQNTNNHHEFDSIQVDIFNGEASGPALSSLDFYQGCHHSLKEVGVMTVNLFSRHPSFKTNINHICDVFENRVLLFNEVHDCNVVVIAFKGPHLEVSWDDLEKRSQQIRKESGLPTKKWVKHLRKCNVQPKKILSI